jgi:hypothetical protein
MARIFLSHRKTDASLAERLADELCRAGHEVWFDEWEINIGDSTVARIDKASKMRTTCCCVIPRQVPLPGSILNGSRHSCDRWKAITSGFSP